MLQEEDSCQASGAEGMDRRTSIYGFCSTHLWLHSGQLDMLHWSFCRAFSNAAVACQHVAPHGQLVAPVCRDLPLFEKERLQL